MTIRELRSWIPADPRFEVVCVHCGGHIANFNNPEYVREAVEAGGGEIIKNAYLVTDCLVACADCADKCLWQAAPNSLILEET